jgi:hypothetical protein
MNQFADSDPHSDIKSLKENATSGTGHRDLEIVPLEQSVSVEWAVSVEKASAKGTCQSEATPGLTGQTR